MEHDQQPLLYIKPNFTTSKLRSQYCCYLLGIHVVIDELRNYVNEDTGTIYRNPKIDISTIV